MAHALTETVTSAVSVSVTSVSRERTARKLRRVMTSTTARHRRMACACEPTSVDVKPDSLEQTVPRLPPATTSQTVPEMESASKQTHARAISASPEANATSSAANRSTSAAGEVCVWSSTCVCVGLAG